MAGLDADLNPDLSKWCRSDRIQVRNNGFEATSAACIFINVAESKIFVSAPAPASSSLWQIERSRSHTRNFGSGSATLIMKSCKVLVMTFLTLIPTIQLPVSRG
jgi:hypothetical protein